MPKKELAVIKKAKTSTKGITMKSEELREMIAREAYLRAEKRGFNGGDPVRDWLEAETKVSEMLNMRA